MSLDLPTLKAKSQMTPKTPSMSWQHEKIATKSVIQVQAMLSQETTHQVHQKRLSLNDAIKSP